MRDAAAAVAERVRRARLAVWAVNEPEVVAVVGALLAGVPIVPINPKTGERELEHIVADSDPALVVAAPGAELPDALARLPRVDVDLEASAQRDRAEPPPDAPAIVMYTSGTTGPPKGVVLPRRSLASNLDALAEAWEWTAEDVLVHGLPLFHVHGLILGVLGPLRLGGSVHHLGRFSTSAAAAALAARRRCVRRPDDVPPVADDARERPPLAAALTGAPARGLGLGGAAGADHERIERITGQRVVERYGMTETLMNTAVRADGERRPGYVGPPLAASRSGSSTMHGATVEDERRRDDRRDPRTRPEPVPRVPQPARRDRRGGPGRLVPHRRRRHPRRPTATSASSGGVATDLIKTGGFKIGAGEIESALLEHAGVAEAAVTGEPDPDLGERIVAWIVLRAGASPSADELARRTWHACSPRTSARASCTSSTSCRATRWARSRSGALLREPLHLLGGEPRPLGGRARRRGRRRVGRPPQVPVGRRLVGAGQREQAVLGVRLAADDRADRDLAAARRVRLEADRERDLRAGR